MTEQCLEQVAALEVPAETKAVLETIVEFNRRRER
jgi:hypothetical protein